MAWLDRTMWVILGAFAFGGCLAFGLQRWWRSVRARRRVFQGQRGEREAAVLLARAGFSVLKEQAPLVSHFLVDGEPRTVDMRVDYLVTDGTDTMVAEVKTGSLVANLSHGPTRRQLFEYAAATGHDRVLLVDAQSKRVSEVAFPVLRRRTGRANVFLVIVLFGAGLWVGYFSSRWWH